MKTDKELGEIGANAAFKAGVGAKNRAPWLLCVSRVTTCGDSRETSWDEDGPYRTAFAAAVREEIFAGVEGMPSVDKLAEAFIDAHNSSDPAYGDVQAGVRAVRNLMLAAFAKQMEEKDAELEIFKRIRDAKIELQAKYDDLQVTMDSVTMNANWSVELMNKAEYKLAAAEKRLAEIAKLPDKWRANRRKETVRGCYLELEQSLKPDPTAEEIERAEFDKLWSSQPSWVHENTDKASAFFGWQAARASEEVKATPAPPQFPV